MMALLEWLFVGFAVAGAVVFALKWRRLRGESAQTRLFRTVFEQSPIGMALVARNGRALETNKALRAILGYNQEDMPHIGVEHISHPDDMQVEIGLTREVLNGLRESYQLEKRMIRRDGRVIWVNMSVYIVRAAERRSDLLVAMVEDITERKTHEEQMKQRAYQDALTGLPNRLLFFDELRYALRQAAPEGERLAVFFIDLDGFKAVNDTYGHDAGDALLKNIADRLDAAIRDRGLAARLGGDEFTILARRVDGEEEAQALAGRLSQAVLLSASAAAEHVGEFIPVTASIGYALYPDDGSDAQTLIKFADIAMYEAKTAGKNRFRRYSGDAAGEAPRIAYEGARP